MPLSEAPNEQASRKKKQSTTSVALLDRGDTARLATMSCGLIIARQLRTVQGGAR